MSKENMKFDPKLFEKNSEKILNKKMYDFQKNVLFQVNLMILCRKPWFKMN